MPIPLSGIRVAIAAAAALLVLSQGSSAQQPFPAPYRPVATAPRPMTAAPRAAAAPASRGGAACHGGMTFDRFLAELNQKAAAAGSQFSLIQYAVDEVGRRWDIRCQIKTHSSP